MSFTDASSDWIWAYRTGSPISSDSASVSLSQHNAADSITLNLQTAAGGSSSNPFLAAAGATTSPSSSTSGASTSSTSTSNPNSNSGGNGRYGDDGNRNGGNGYGGSSGNRGANESGPNSHYDNVLMAHGIVGPVAWVLMFPIGAIAIRTLSFRGLIWLHAGWMILAYILVLSSMGLGIWLALTTGQLDAYHSIIGLIVVCSLLFQPVTGLARKYIQSTFTHIYS
jgi:hypothetical protein